MWPWENPEALRLFRARLRPRTMFTIGFLAVLVLGATLGILYVVQDKVPLPGGFLALYFHVAAALMFLGPGLYGLNLASQSIIQEREQNTLDFQRLVTIGPWRLALGKLLGAPAEAWFAIGCGIFFLMLPVLAGAVHPGVLGLLLICLAVFMVFLSGLGLACSAMAPKSSQAAGLAVSLLIGFSILFGAIGHARGLGFWRAWSPWELYMYLVNLADPSARLPLTSIDFFSLPAPLPLGFVVLNLFWACFFLALAARRLDNEELSLLAPKHGLVFLAGLEILLVGSLWDTVVATRGGSLAAFHAAHLLALAGLALLLMPQPHTWRSWVHPHRRNQHWRVLLGRRTRTEDSSPLVLVLIAGAGYAVVAAGLECLQHRGLPPATHWLPMLAVLGFSLAVCSLAAVLQLYCEKHGLRIALAVVWGALILPSVMLGLMGRQDAIPLVNPAAYVADEQIWAVQAPLPLRYPPSALWACPLICLVAAALLTALAAMRIRFLLDMREAEREKEAGGRGA